MQFNNSAQAIYLQIAEYVCEKIILKEWSSGSKIPSVRELAIQLEVNPNTVARSYDFLKQQNIIYDKRGIGYFISEEGVENAISYRKQEFLEVEMPLFFRNMYLLAIDPKEMNEKFEMFKKQYS